MTALHGIAVVGMACRYPDARTPLELWQTVVARRRAFRRIPDQRMPMRDYHSEDRGAPDRTYATQAAVIEGWVFDRLSFRVAGSTYRAADLAHWLALEVAAEALADAGHADGDGLPRSTTGVLLGNTLTGDVSRAQTLRLRWPFVRRVVNSSLTKRGWDAATRRELLEALETDYKAPFAPVGEESLAGALSNTIAGRICNHFDLKGGGFTVDGACASSLLAVVQSCSSLEARDLDVAIAGGVDLSLDPFEIIGFAKTGALAAGPMRVYDTRADGFVPGEGCGMVVLMRHADAVAQGRRIYAVLRGWGVASDGSGGITRPEAAGQRLAVDRAYRRAGYGIESVSYFEGHGTGTSLGDTTELGVLSGARREAGARGRAAIGSIKSNFGHTKAAAGVAGLLKATLAIHRRVLPPTTGCERPHSELSAPNATLRVLDAAEAWPSSAPLRASVSAMGFGGIDAHVTLEGASAEPVGRLGEEDARLSSSGQDVELFVFGGADAATVRQQVEQVLGYASRLSLAELSDLAHALVRALPSAADCRVRGGVVASTPLELSERLAALHQALAADTSAASSLPAGVMWGSGSGAPRIGFLFPGQGSPSDGGVGAIGRRFPQASTPHWTAERRAGEEPSSTRIAQPAIVAASVAGLRVLKSLGLEADVALGHSLGELSALHWAGVMDEAAVVRVATARGRAMADLGRSDGAMASVAADVGTVSGFLVPGAEVSLAAFNAPQRTVVSGERGAVESVIAAARAAGRAAVRLPVSHAFHTPLVAAAVPELKHALALEALAPLTRSTWSTVTGTRLESGHDVVSLLLDQVTAPVRFMQALSQASREVDLWIEVGPGSVLTSLALDCGVSRVVATEVGSSSLTGLLEALGTAWTMGAALDPMRLFEDRFTRPFALDWRPTFIQNPCEAGADAAETELESHVQSAGEPAVETLEYAKREVESPLRLVRELICAKAELPAEAVGEGSRLLADLHLNSISVGEILVAAARRLGVPAPAAPTDYARATVGEVAEALASRLALGGAGGQEHRAGDPPGVAAWIRTFVPRWVPRERPAEPRASGSSEWQVVAEEGDPLASQLGAALARLPGAPGVLLCLPARSDAHLLPLMVHAVQAVIAQAGDARFAVVQRGPGAASLARTLHLEHPDVTVCVVTIPEGHADATRWIVAEVAAAVGFVEARYEPDGSRTVPVLTVAGTQPPAESLRLGPEDVLLVTGGGKGIAAECALALARAGGARLLILGRSAPEHDRELSENLSRMARAGLQVRYAMADVTDAAAVAGAVREAVNDLGPVTAVVHGAGTNVPRLLESLSVEDFARTLAPKLDGARHVLAAVDPSRLRFFVAFGSVIARTGLRGEADYGLANEWMSRWVEELQAQRPGCRCMSVEWSVWSGVGMGQRLGRVDALAEAGVAALGVDDAVAVLSRLIEQGAPAPVVVAAGRLGHMSTLETNVTALPLLRFLERVHVHVPGVELVVDARLTPERDPYLEDHVFRGERILPAVISMEAMAQVAMASGGWSQPPEFENLEFLQPIVAPAEGPLTLRVAALLTEPGRVQLVLRSATTAFQADHVRATATQASTPPRSGERVHPSAGASRVTAARGERSDGVLLDPARELYGGVLFHRGRFQRLSGYRSLRATECSADLMSDGAVAWFGDYLPERLVLGDPAARDAALHAIQACVPHRSLLPVSVRRVSCSALDAHDRHSLHAIERAHDAEGFEYDLSIRDGEGREVERWEGLRLAIVRGEPTGVPEAPALFGPYLERRLAELIPGSALRVAIARGGTTHSERSALVSRELTGLEELPTRRPDGRPDAVANGNLSVSHAGRLTLAVIAPHRTACDLQSVATRAPELWVGLLGGAYHALARESAREAAEDEQVAATRVWCAIECLKKRGAPNAAPLVIESRNAGGWVVLRSGDDIVATLVTDAADDGCPLVLAVLAPVTEAAMPARRG